MTASTPTKPNPTTSTSTIRHDARAQRFATTVDGVEGHVDYTLDGDALTITHTRVPDAIGGRGIAGELVRAAYEHAHAHELKVVPQCSYAAEWLRRNPQFASLDA